LDLMDPSDAKYDRLLLNPKRIGGLVESINEITALKDPANEVAFAKTLENGLQLTKKWVPMGVVGTIFESRPNVTIDVAILCLMSGNACVLKGGKEAAFSNTCLVGIIHEALAKNGIAKEAVLLLPTDRKFLAELLVATRFVDLIIPRGSQSLIDYVRANSKIPCIETGAGVCHTYVEKTADLNMAADIIINARASRPSVCNSLDCAILDESVLELLVPLLKEGFDKYQIEVYADEVAYPIFKKKNFNRLFEAKAEDFGKEWLDYKISIKTVSGLNEALEHVSQFSSKH
jgi:glutamate-5-semialdehyde dehydrogenase